LKSVHIFALLEVVFFYGFIKETVKPLIFRIDMTSHSLPTFNIFSVQDYNVSTMPSHL
jgi:hypothetical protein